MEPQRDAQTLDHLFPGAIEYPLDKVTQSNMRVILSFGCLTRILFFNGKGLS